MIIWILKGLATVLSLPLLALFALSDRIPRKKVRDVPPQGAGLRPEEAERPAMLPHKLDPVTPDRPMPLYFAAPADQWGFALACARARIRLEKMALEAKRDRAIAEDIAKMLGPVNESDPR